jgi:hypothetical protein
VEGDSNAYWDQSRVTVQSTKTLKSLKVVVKITQTGGVASTGTWSNIGDKVSVSSASSSGELDYVVTLKPGVTLEPGTYIFRFQYNHNQGNRDAGGDRYNVTATSTAGPPSTARAVSEPGAPPGGHRLHEGRAMWVLRVEVLQGSSGTRAGRAQSGAAPHGSRPRRREDSRWEHTVRGGRTPRPRPPPPPTASGGADSWDMWWRPRP